MATGKEKAIFETSVTISPIGISCAKSKGKYIWFGSRHPYKALTKCPYVEYSITEKMFIPDNEGVEAVYRHSRSIAVQTARLIINQVCESCPFFELCEKNTVSFGFDIKPLNTGEF